MLWGTNSICEDGMTTSAATWNDENKTMLTVTRDADGWFVREMRDSQIVRQVRMSDWHRVERVLRLGILPTDAVVVAG
jgi:hypothetical protein